MCCQSPVSFGTARTAYHTHRTKHTAHTQTTTYAFAGLRLRLIYNLRRNFRPFVFVAKRRTPPNPLQPGPYHYTGCNMRIYAVMFHSIFTARITLPHTHLRFHLSPDRVRDSRHKMKFNPDALPRTTTTTADKSNILWRVQSTANNCTTRFDVRRIRVNPSNPYASRVSRKSMMARRSHRRTSL